MKGNSIKEARNDQQMTRCFRLYLVIGASAES